MSQSHGLILDNGYRPRSAAVPLAQAERSFPFWTVVFVLLAAMAAFAPSLAFTVVSDLQEPSPASCVGSDGRDGLDGAEGVAASAAARRVVTEAVVAGHAPREGRC